MKDMQAEQLLCWSGLADEEHISSSNEVDFLLKIDIISFHL